MTVKLGMFMMPFHPYDRDYGAVLAEDQEAIVLADRLGLTEAFVGEHFSRLSEPITSPLIFLATLVPRTERIALGTGVLNLPQTHPATVAAHAAMFDHLCRGRFIMGIGPGGLVSDFELFDVAQAEQRPQMMLESIDAFLKLWGEDPPYDIAGRFWKMSLGSHVYPEFGVGRIPRPYQQPHPRRRSIISANEIRPINSLSRWPRTITSSSAPSLTTRDIESPTRARHASPSQKAAKGFSGESTSPTVMSIMVRPSK
jgi:alkanesulfonate monooxygenase SsuD/methylene tetrahydromethanopterin reductase-like flavin-dependent oxidoreductase (luciferase family)